MERTWGSCTFWGSTERLFKSKLVFAVGGWHSQRGVSLHTVRSSIREKLVGMKHARKETNHRHDICQISYTSVYPTNMKIYPTKSSINIFEITVKICSLWDILPTGEIILQKHCLCQISCLKISKYVDNPPQKCMKCHGNIIYCIQCHYFLQIKHLAAEARS